MGLFSRKKKVADPEQSRGEDKDKKSEPVVIEEKKANPPAGGKPVVKATPVTKIKAESKAKTTKAPKREIAYKVLVRPIISEKATMGASIGKYVFEVSLKANKVEVKKAIEEVYGVVPASVNVINKRGKTVHFGRHFGATKNTKKVIVTLKKGDTIKLYEGI